MLPDPAAVTPFAFRPRPPSLLPEFVRERWLELELELTEVVLPAASWRAYGGWKVGVETFVVAGVSCERVRCSGRRYGWKP